ncbi:hypothetical protein HPB52_010680 [Rhipicephalus sanguineus]|uniref:Uncharacterized protein n=1 Tax=Rhipicephalus sanguineus TaxID=34632 RepID=A0A9D4T3H0_RHISA|nr:hypothetical protein HPB52_010680 [Rhipicephalus sanguineus]
MSGLRVCGCLNWSVHCQEVQPCDLRQKAPADPFFKGGLVCAKLAPQGITKRHLFLESVRTVGDWEVHSCQGCHWDVYAQASDRSLLLSANLESDVKRIEAMRASTDYSPCFHILLPPVADKEGDAARVAPGVTEEETIVARLHVQQLAAQFLQKELDAMEARLRRAGLELDDTEAVPTHRESAGRAEGDGEKTGDERRDAQERPEDVAAQTAEPIQVFFSM